MFYSFIVCLTLSALLAINALASLGAEALWRAIRRGACRWSARTRAQIIFSLRVFPLAGALIGVAALILPSYLTYEPWPIDDVVTTKIATLTLISALGIGFAFRRGLASWRVTQRLAAIWMRDAEVVSLAESPIPVYRIRHPFPVVAVVGVSRPRLFIANQIFDSLSHDEIAASVRHEAGHLAMRDNLKRVLMRICRDVLIIAPCGRSLDRDWGEATEAAADEHAARAGADIALNLASALIKIARLIPAGAKPAMPAGAFLIDEEDDGVVWRVRQLTQLAETSEEANGRSVVVTQLALGACLSLFLVGVVAAAASPMLLARLHAGMEHIFWFLS